MTRTFIGRRLAAAIAAVLGAASQAAGQGTVQSVTFAPDSPVAAGTTVTITVAASAPCGGIGINYGDGTSVVYPISSLPLVKTRTYPAPGQYTVVATGHGNCTGTVTRTLEVVAPPAARPDLTVPRLEQMPAGSVAAGGSVTYRISVRNVSAASASAVQVDLRLSELAWTAPAGGIGPRCTLARSEPNGSIVRCEVGALAAGQLVTVPVQLVAPAALIGMTERTVRVTASADPANRVPEADETNNTSRELLTRVTSPAGDSPPAGTPPPAGTTPPPSGTKPPSSSLPVDLTVASVEQTPSGTIRSGMPVSYAIVIRNLEKGAVSNVQLEMKLQSGLWTTPSAGIGQGCVITEATPGGTRVRCPVGSVGSGASVTVTVRLVAPALAQGTVSDLIPIAIRVDPDSVVVETNESNNQRASATRVQQLPDLVIDTAGLPTTMTAGQNVTYPSRLRNAGAGGASSVVLRATLPSRFEVVRIENTNATCSVQPSSNPGQAGPSVRCTRASIGPNEDVRADIVARSTITEVDGTTALFTLQADPDNTVEELSETNNIGAVSTTISATSDIRLLSPQVTYHLDPLRDPRSVTCRAPNTTIVVRVRNDGPGRSAATRVTFNYVAGFRSNADCSPGAICVDGSCMAAPANVESTEHCFDSCRVPALLNGQTHEIRLRVHRPSAVDVIATATLDPNRTVNDPDRSNNTRTIRR